MWLFESFCERDSGIDRLSHKSICTYSSFQFPQLKSGILPKFYCLNWTELNIDTHWIWCVRRYGLADFVAANLSQRTSSRTFLLSQFPTQNINKSQKFCDSANPFPMGYAGHEFLIRHFELCARESHIIFGFRISTTILGSRQICREEFETILPRRNVVTKTEFTHHFFTKMNNTYYINK